MKNSQAYWRQIDILNKEDINNVDVGIIGAGSVGSPLSLLLAKMGVDNLEVWDFDKIEIHNLPNQLFRISDLGKKKVDALKEIVKDFSEEEIKVVDKKWDGTMKSILIVAVDSMDTRIDIWNEVKKHEGEVDLLIETRMGAELMRIYAINPLSVNQVEFYEATLYPSSKAKELPCTERTIFYNVFMISGFVGAIIKHHLKNEKYPKELVYNLKDFSYMKTN